MLTPIPASIPPDRKSSKLKPGAMEEEHLPSSASRGKSKGYFDQTGSVKENIDEGKKKRKRLTKDRLNRRKQMLQLSSSEDDSVYNSNDEYIPPSSAKINRVQKRVGRRENWRNRRRNRSKNK
jgi:hypothetical protein